MISRRVDRDCSHAPGTGCWCSGNAPSRARVSLLDEDSWMRSLTRIVLVVLALGVLLNVAVLARDVRAQKVYTRCSDSCSSTS